VSDKTSHSPDALPLIKQKVRERTPVGAEIDPLMRAAVAMVLAPAERDLHVLLIKRAEHPLDPWSGHMAFPGGRHDATDRNLQHTAVRETLEEVGIDLGTHGELVGPLDDVQAMANGHHLSMVITPFLFALDEVRTGPIDTREVASVVWVPLRALRDESFHGTTSVTRHGFTGEFPAFLYQGHTVWGLTYRILRGFLETL
jgi:8-oxo-dGTP pyrophosphatase MutT (NUDIX family)